MSQACASSNHGSWKHITVPTTMTYAASTMQCKRCGVSQCRIVSHRVLLSVAATVAELMFPVSRCVRNTRDCCIVGFCATNGCGSCAAGSCCSAGSGSGTSTGTSLSVGIDFSESKMLLMPSSLASIALSEDQWRPLHGSSLNDGAVLGQCAQTGTGLSFYTPRGRYLCSILGENNRNVLLRRSQYRFADDTDSSARFARSFVIGKIFNSRWVLERTKRDHNLRVNVERLSGQSQALSGYLKQVSGCNDVDAIRGLEGLWLRYSSAASSDRF